MPFEACRPDACAAGEIGCAQALDQDCVIDFGLDGSWFDLGQRFGSEKPWIHFLVVEIQ